MLRKGGPGGDGGMQARAPAAASSLPLSLLKFPSIGWPLDGTVNVMAKPLVKYVYFNVSKLHHARHSLMLRLTSDITP